MLAAVLGCRLHCCRPDAVAPAKAGAQPGIE